MFDYETLKIIWALLILIITIGFSVAEGMVMGTLANLMFFKKNEERRVIINSIGMHWEGNQVWLVLAGGAMFAAWPMFYASAFSTLHTVLYLVLATLFLRATGFEYRAKVENKKWRKWWDIGLIIAGIVPPLVIGVGLGNLFIGLPIDYTPEMNPVFVGNLLTFFSPISLLFGIVGASIFALQGSSWLYLRADESMLPRLSTLTKVLAILVMVGFIACLLVVSQMNGFSLKQIVDVNTALIITDKSVVVYEGAWIHNFVKYPLLWSAPSLVVALLGLSLIAKVEWQKFLIISLANAFIVVSVAFLLSPFILPSSLNPTYSLTIWDAVSSEKTLFNMFVVACIFVPIVLSYTIWCYYKMWGKIKLEDIGKSHIIY